MFAAPAFAQSTWHVDVVGTPPGSGSAANPYTSIQYAIDRPSTIAGDTLLVRRGTYFENVSFGGKTISLVSVSGPDATIIDGGGVGPCVAINGAPANPLLEGFTLTNGAYFVGAGLWIQSSNAIVRDCAIRNNTAISKGGGVWIAYCSPSIERCDISNNQVTSPNGSGGGMHSMYGFTLRLSHCTFTGNSSANTAGYSSEFSTGATVENSIFWNDGGAEFSAYQSNIALRYCDVEGGFGGTGNFSADPLFWNPIGFDFHLKPGSPCIDAGDPASPLDPDGTRADVGAHPFASSWCGTPSGYCIGKQNSQGCTPAIAWSGTPSATAPGTFQIITANVINNKTGLLIYGYDPNEMPWQGGLLCATPPIKRCPPLGSAGNPPPNDCSGSLTFDFNARIQSGVDPGLAIAATVYAQYYYRDPPASFGVGLSNAVAFTICP